MAKIKMKTTLKTKENLINCDVSAIKNGNHYSYLENEYTVVIDIGEKCAKMVRKKDDYELVFTFNKAEESSCTIYLGENETSIPVITKKLEVTESKILIVYEIDKEEFQYLIQY